jgi:hypothetical protein
LYVQILGCQLNPNVSEIAQIDKFQEVHRHIPGNEKIYIFLKSVSYVKWNWHVFFKQFLSQRRYNKGCLSPISDMDFQFLAMWAAQGRKLGPIMSKGRPLYDKRFQI